MRIVITGATGFLGSHLVEALHESDHDVVAVVRKTSNTDFLKAHCVACCDASLSTGEGLDRALDGADAVLHCAGGGQVTDPAAIHDQNVAPTKTVLEATTKYAPNARFVFASSIAAGQARSDYGRAKRLSEDLVAASSLRTTSLRLPSLYGPYDTRWLPVFRAAKKGISPIVNQGAKLSVLYGSDAASAMLAPLRDGAPSGGVHAVDDAQPVTQRELGGAVGEAIGKKLIEVRVPALVLRAAASAAVLAGKVAGTKVFLTHDKVSDMLADDWAIDSTPFREAFGWQSRVRLADGMRETAEWLRREGLL